MLRFTGALIEVCEIVSMLSNKRGIVHEGEQHIGKRNASPMPGTQQHKMAAQVGDLCPAFGEDVPLCVPVERVEPEACSNPCSRYEETSGRVRIRVRRYSHFKLPESFPIQCAVALCDLVPFDQRLFSIKCSRANGSNGLQETLKVSTMTMAE